VILDFWKGMVIEEFVGEDMGFWFGEGAGGKSGLDVERFRRPSAEYWVREAK
jgi:hypothetical protein